MKRKLIMAIVGIGNNAIPFALIGFSETQIDSIIAYINRAFYPLGE